MKIMTTEEIIFESYLRSNGYHYKQFKNPKIYLPKIYLPNGRFFQSDKYIAEIDFCSKEKIIVTGYGYPKTLTIITEQLKILFKRDIELNFESDEPRNCYGFYGY